MTLALAALLAALPFLAAGVVIALAIKTWVVGVSRIYAFDLAGAGLGALAIVPLLWLVDAPTLVVALGVVAGVAALLFAGGARLERRLAALVSAGAAAAPGALLRHLAERAARALRLHPRAGGRALDADQPRGRLSAGHARRRRDRLVRPGRGAGAGPQARRAAAGLARPRARPAEHRLRAERAGSRADDRRRRRARHLQRALLRQAAGRRDRAEQGDPRHGRRGPRPLVRAALRAARRQRWRSATGAPRSRPATRATTRSTSASRTRSRRAPARRTRCPRTTSTPSRRSTSTSITCSPAGSSASRASIASPATRCCARRCSRSRRSSGAASRTPERHVVVMLGRDTLNAFFGTVLVGREPFTRRAAHARRGRSAPSEPSGWCSLPAARPGASGERWPRHESPEAFCESYPIDVCAPTDDRPFFLNPVRLGDLGEEAPAGSTFISRTPFLVLLVALGILVALSLLAFVLPLLLVRSAERPPAGSLAFFAAIGLGFLMLEVVLIQRFVLFLGFPTYALSVVLFALLLFTGAGAWLSARLRGRAARAGAPPGRRDTPHRGAGAGPPAAAASADRAAVRGPGGGRGRDAGAARAAARHRDAGRAAAALGASIRRACPGHGAINGVTSVLASVLARIRGNQLGLHRRHAARRRLLRRCRSPRRARQMAGAAAAGGAHPARPRPPPPLADGTVRSTLQAAGAAVLLGGPTALAFFSGGFFDRPRLIAALGAWAVALAAAFTAPRPLPASAPGRVALVGLAALCAWTALSLLWTPMAGATVDDLQRLLLYLGYRGRRRGAVRTAVGRPRAGAGSRRGGAGGHGLRALRAAAAGSRRPGRERHGRRPARAAADLLERHRGAGGRRPRPLRPNGGRPTPEARAPRRRGRGRRAARGRGLPELLARGARGAGGGVGRLAGACACRACAGPRTRARHWCRARLPLYSRAPYPRCARSRAVTVPGECRGLRCSLRSRCLPLRRRC